LAIATLIMHVMRIFICLPRFEDVTAVSGVPAKTRQALMEFGEFIEALGRQRFDERPVTEILSRLLDLQVTWMPWRGVKTLRAMSRAENVKVLLSVAREFDARDVEGAGVCADFWRKLRL